MRIIFTFSLLLLATLSIAQINLSSFFGTDAAIAQKVDSIYNSMSDADRVGQIIMPAVGNHGKATEYVIGLIKKRQLGGILLLNGNREGFKKMVKEFDSIGKEAGCLPFLYSADAEPSLIKYKIKNCTPVPNANKHKTTAEVKSTAKSISKDLNYIGINYNFAPVVDQGTENPAITNRSFGFNVDSI
ncbi:MAG: hypothetical protein JKY54_01470, partial [Flavobacteriales bacterium]|nr:hypothetical protein [Flavobacteriales bacterium]